MACYDGNNTLHDSVCTRICKTGSFEADITSKLTKDIFPRLRGETFLDVGMNVGTYGLLAASYGMKVIGFEPMPHNIALLRASFCANLWLVDTGKCEKFAGIPVNSRTGIFSTGKYFYWQIQVDNSNR